MQFCQQYFSSKEVFFAGRHDLRPPSNSRLRIVLLLMLCNWLGSLSLIFSEVILGDFFTMSKIFLSSRPDVTRGRPLRGRDP